MLAGNAKTENDRSNVAKGSKLWTPPWPITLSIIGCVVNGPGEAAMTDIGITGGGKDSSMLYLKGLQTEKINNQEIVSKIVNLVEKKAIELENNKQWFHLKKLKS